MAIPAWNEAETIAEVIAEVRAAVPEADIAVLDDASTDATGKQAEAAGAVVLTLPRHGGVGTAMRAAFRHAREHDYDSVVQVDADGQHDPASIPDIVDALRTSNVVVGTRFGGEGGYPLTGPRRWTMWALAKGFSQLTRTTLTDTTSGFRGADRRAIELFARQYPSEYLGDTLGSIVIASRMGLSIAEVPVRMRPRQGGRPSHNPIQAALLLGRSAGELAAALAHGRLRRPGGRQSR